MLPLEQLRPQLPQLFGSLARSAQPLPHIETPAAHVQTPPEQEPPGPQETSHAPQWLGSVVITKQPLGHNTCPTFGHPQFPEVHVAPGTHLMLQPPLPAATDAGY